MIIFPDYVASFTSPLSVNAAAKIISENVEKANDNSEGFQINSADLKGETKRFGFIFGKKISLKRFFYPEMKAIITEKTDGALVFTRLDASFPLKILAIFIAFLFLLLEIGIVFLAGMGHISFFYPVIAIPFFFIFCLLIEHIWAKLCCIKAYRHLCNVLQYKPPKVMIIKVLKK